MILAIWKQALDICHTYAASATEGSSSQESARSREASNIQHSPNTQEFFDIANSLEPHDICSLIERAFLHEVGNAEELANMIERGKIKMSYNLAFSFSQHSFGFDLISSRQRFFVLRKYGDAGCNGTHISVCPCIRQTRSSKYSFVHELLYNMLPNVPKTFMRNYIDFVILCSPSRSRNTWAT